MPTFRKFAARSAAAAALLLVLSASARAEGDLARRIPSDALFAAWVNNAEQARADLSRSPYGRLWSDPACDALRAELDRAMQKAISDNLSEEEQARFREFVDKLKGGMGIYVRPASADGNITFEADSIHLTGILETDEAGRAWIEQNLNPFRDEADVKKDSYSVGAVTVYRQTVTEAPEAPEPTDPSAEGEATEPAAAPKTKAFQYAWTGTCFVFTDGTEEQSMREALALFADDTTAGPKSLRATSLASLPQQQTGAGAGDLTVFFDVEQLVKGAVSTIRESAGPSAPPNLDAVVASTGLSDLREITMTVRGDEKGAYSDFFLTTTPTRNGLVKAWLESGTITMDSVKRAPADSLTVAAFALDLGKVWDAVLATVETAKPGSSNMINMMVISQQSNLGVDAVSSIVRNIAGEHTLVSRPMEDAAHEKARAMNMPEADSVAFYFGVKNGEQVVSAFRTIIEMAQKNPDMAGSFLSEEKDGITTVRLPETMDAQIPYRPAFAISREALVFTNTEGEMQNVVRALTGKQPGPLAETAACRAAMERAPREGLIGWNFTTAEGLTAFLHQAKSTLTTNPVNDEDIRLTADMIPSPAVAKKYLASGDSWVTFRDETVRMCSQVLAPAPGTVPATEPEPAAAPAAAAEKAPAGT